jgi:hypothetical protein
LRSKWKNHHKGDFILINILWNKNYQDL